MHKTVLDLGCGYGSDVDFLRTNGIDAYGYDPYINPFGDGKYIVGTENIHCNLMGYDIVLMTYVLNVIQDPKDRILAINRAKLSMRLNAEIAITTRTKKEIDRLAKGADWIKHSDGYLTKAGTFQKGFSPGELEAIMKNLHFYGIRTVSEDRFNTLIATREVNPDKKTLSSARIPV